MKYKTVLTVTLILSILMAVISFSPGAKVVADDTLIGTKICLDPGHGGTDPGAINPTYGLRESDINLEVSYGLRHLLEGSGAVVVMTRTSDQYLTNSDRYTFCNAEQATILISVHTNSHTDPSWDGSMTLYGPRESPELAQTIHDVMYPYLRDTRPTGMLVEDFVDYGVDHFASGVLFKSNMPATMVEPLLMSNVQEAPLLVTNIFDDFEPTAFDYDNATFADTCSDFSCRRGQIAWTVYQGTLAYFGAQTGGDMYVAAISMDYVQRGRNYSINTAVTILDMAGQPVPAAEITLQVTQLPDGVPQIQTALTDTDGIASFMTKMSSAGEYEAAVIDVAKADWNYDPALNVESTASLMIP